MKIAHKTISFFVMHANYEMKAYHCKLPNTFQYINALANYDLFVLTVSICMI